MNFEDRANDSKKRTNLMTSITIDWQYAQQLLPQVFFENAHKSSEFKTICANLNKFCSNIEQDIKELKSMIPNSNE